jgi:K+-sensing histidine kinase KdpD
MTQAAAEDGALPRLLTALPQVRRGVGFALAAAAPALLTAVLAPLRDDLSLASVLLLFQLAVVVVALVGGTRAAVVAAVWSFLLANWFLTRPLHTLRVEDRDSLVGLGVFLAVALTVSALVDVAASRTAAAARSRVEAELLGRLAAEPVASTTVESVLGEVATAFGMTSVALVGADLTRPVALVGPPFNGPPAVQVDAAPGLRLAADGPVPFAEDRRLLGDLARAAARAHEAGQLSDQAARGRELAEVDRLRSALLAAVGHDLRTPLSGITAAASALRQDDVALTPVERDELLGTIEQSAGRLTDMVANLLDLSRLRAGALVVVTQAVALDEVVARAVISGHLEGVDVAVPDDLPLVLADPGLLERVVANLLDNARRHSPPDDTIAVQATAATGTVRLDVVDHGSGVAEADRARMFEPFQRLDDRGGSGVGLGLAIAAGLVEAMAGSVVPSTTPGGGLTMSVTLPRAVPT